jgi:voltage-gated potassium channel
MNSPFPPSSQAETYYGKPDGGIRLRLYQIIFESDTPAGWRFDVTLVIAILLSITVVVIDSIQSMSQRYGVALDILEWLFTLLFSVEYVLRLFCVRHPLRYAVSFFGIVDLLSILPTYMALIIPDTALLLDVRILRLLRIFRIFKLTVYVAEYSALAEALRASRRKIAIFISVVLMLVLVLGTVMYVVEGPKNGYTSIPVAMYWAIVTMTTVGYGDITPHTNVGKFIASIMMLLGWGILAVPTGIVSSEITAQRFARHFSKRRCPQCSASVHDADAKFCKICGASLPTSEPADAIK